MRVVKQLWEGWKRVAEKIVRVQTLILLTLLYVILILPFGFLASLLGDPLGVRRAAGSSLWRSRRTPPADPDTARRQF